MSSKKNHLRRLSWAPIIGLAQIAGLGCAEEELNEPAFDNAPIQVVLKRQHLNNEPEHAEDTGAQAAATNSRREDVDSLTYQIAESWALSGANCLGDETTPLSPDEIMADVEPAKRAEAIYNVINTVPLSAFRIRRLLELIGTTQDREAAAYIADIWDRADELVDRYNRTEHEPEIAAATGLSDFKVSADGRKNMVSSVRLGAVKGASSMSSPRASDVLSKALDDEDPLVRGTAIVELAKRSDVRDAERLRAAAAGLDGWPEVQAAVNNRR